MKLPLGVFAGIVVLSVIGIGIAKTRRVPTLAEREARRREIIQTESIEGQMQRVAEEGGYYGLLSDQPELAKRVVTAEALEGEALAVELPKNAGALLFLLEDIRGSSATLEAKGVSDTLDLKPNEGTRWGSVRLPYGWEGKLSVTLRGAGYARLTFSAPPPGFPFRRPTAEDPKSLEEALSQVVGPLKDQGFVPLAEFTGGGEDKNPYRPFSAPSGDLLLVWALDPTSNDARSMHINVTRNDFMAQSIAAGPKETWGGAVPFRLGRGSYIFQIGASGKWAVSVFKKK